MMRSNIWRIAALKHRPTLETMERIATGLKVSVADWIVSRWSSARRVVIPE
jgi:transcriptional regulator with XRE-family HTH domain